MLKNVYLFLRQRETEHEQGGSETKRKTQNLKQPSGSELSAQSPTRGSNLQAIDHDLSQSRTPNQPSHPGAPLIFNCLLGSCKFLDMIWGT